jgi:hypothetical protein
LDDLKRRTLEEETFKGFNVTFTDKDHNCWIIASSGKIYSKEKKELTFEEAISEVRNDYAKDPNNKDFREEKVTLSGTPAFKFSYYSNGLEQIGIFTSQKEDLFYIFFARPETNNKCKNIYDQMIPTFKFLD